YFLFPARVTIEPRRQMGEFHPRQRGHVFRARELGGLCWIAKRAAQRARRYIVFLRDEHHGLRRRKQDEPASPRPNTGDRTKETSLAAAPLADDQNPLSRIDHDMLLAEPRAAAGRGDADLVEHEPVVGRRYKLDAAC